MSLLLEAGVLDGAVHRVHDALEERVRELVELRPRERLIEVLGPVLVGRDERQVDVAGLRRAQLDLGLLGGLVETLQGHLVFAQVDALALQELGHHPVDDGLVEVVAAEVRVAVGGTHLEDALPEVEDGDVEGAAAEVEHEDRLVVLLVEAVGERGGRGLVDDALDLEAGDLAGVLGGLALRVVEVRRDGDDRLVDLVAEILLGVALELLQDHRRDLRRRVRLAADLDDGVAVRAGLDVVRHDGHLFGHVAVLAAHEALDREHGVLGVGDGLTPGDAAYQALAALRERDHRRRGATALTVRDDGRLAALEHGHGAVGRAQVDADYLAHEASSLRGYTLRQHKT